MKYIFYIFIGLLIFSKVYDVLTSKYCNPYKTTLYYGKKGCGKTTLLTKIAIENIKNDKIVYSTVEIPGTRLFDPKRLKDERPEDNSILLIDEIGLIWDNRDFKSFEKGVNEFFKYARQYKCTVHMFSQVPDIDIKIRNLCDSYYLLENKFRVFSYGRKISKVLTVGKNIDGQGQLIDSFQFESILTPKSRIVTFIPRWSAFYNSYDPPVRPKLLYKEMPMNDLQVYSMYHPKLYMIKVIGINFKNKIINKIDKLRKLK